MANQLLGSNVKPFVFQAHGILYHSFLGQRVIEKKRRLRGVPR
jgi:hypothetical protein